MIESANRSTLLILDDERDVVRSLYHQFRLDYDVVTFTRPADALAYLESQDVGVIMSDQRMPEMNGVDFLATAARLRPDATRLLFTGYTDIRAVIAAINQGHVFRYITKPWDYEELATIIRQAFEVHDLIVSRRRLVAELQEANTRLEEANRVKTAFIEVASHELNTPVAVVLGLTELWRLDQSNQACPLEQSWVDRIQRAGKRLAGTVERMLKLLRAGQLDQTLERQPTELAPLIRGVVAELQPFLEVRQQTVELELAPDLGVAEIDAEKIGDVLTNLLANAIKFTPDGCRIVVSAEAVGEDRVRLRVADPGVGIGEADRRHLFEPFFTGYDTRRHSSGEFQFCKRGIGLGLHLVERFVDLHGGQIEVRSVPDQGSTFVVTLPRHAPTPHRPRPARAAG